MLHSSNLNTAQKAYFIVIEGIDGAGKSSNLKTITDFFEAQSQPIIYTREPGGTDIGEKIRTLLLNEAMHIETETLLMFASRKEHLEQVILPALQKGQHVLSDRFTDATYAYQGAGRGLSEDRIATLENWVQNQFRPDFTFIFDLPLETAQKRRQQVSAGDRFEHLDDAFFNRVRNAYLHRAQQAPDKYAVIDSSQSIEQVRQQVLYTLTRRFG